MKKITVLIFGVLLVSQLSFAQSRRMVLAEECTSSTCPPCASQNPAFDALLQANSDVITAIKYHVWWPSPGTDPMYLDNTGDNQARTNYYGVTGVPTAIIDGNYFVGSPQSVAQALINAASSIPSPFEIQTQQTLSAGEDSIYVTSIIHATDNVSGNLKAQTVVIEKHIHFDGGPGLTNGERDFYNVMKKLLPNAQGTTLPSSMQSGDYVILQNAWKLENVYDNNELGVVVFVQDNSNKDVHQAGNSSEDPLTPVYSNDVEVMNLSNVPSTNCSGSVVPYIKIRNNGSDDVTSLTINYSVNDVEQTYEWTGNLSFLQSATVELNEISFDVADTNYLTITGVNPNGSEDDFTSNNSISYMIKSAPTLTGNSFLILYLDSHPEETSWEIKNSTGEVVQFGGPYESAGQVIEPITVSENDCYEFTIYDTGGDGTDYYAVVYGDNEVAFDGSDFGYFEKNEFAYGTVSTEELKAFTDMNVFPNPAADQLNIEFYLPKQNKVEINIVDLVGKTVYTDESKHLNAGPQNINLRTDFLVPGIYILEVKIGSEMYTKKISIK